MVHNVRDCFRGVNCRLDRGLGAGCIVQSSDLQRLQDDGDDAEGDPQDGLRPEVMEEPTDVRQAHACATPLWDTCEVVARSWNGKNGGYLCSGTPPMVAAACKLPGACGGFPYVVAESDQVVDGRKMTPEEIVQAVVEQSQTMARPVYRGQADADWEPESGAVYRLRKADDLPVDEGELRNLVTEYHRERLIMPMQVIDGANLSDLQRPMPETLERVDIEHRLEESQRNVR